MTSSSDELTAIAANSHHQQNFATPGVGHKLARAACTVRTKYMLRPVSVYKDGQSHRDITHWFANMRTEASGLASWSAPS